MSLICTRQSSAALGVQENTVIKTLIFQQHNKELLCVLQHGDRSVDTKALAAFVGTKKISSAAPESAEEATGYQVGGCSPWGQRTPMPLYVQSTIADLKSEDGSPAEIHINGGARGVLVRMRVDHLLQVLPEHKLVDCAQAHKREAVAAASSG